jgi:hypothetical protein
MLNVKTLTDTMSRMELPQLQQYAALHKNDPYIVTLALSIANQKKQMKTGQDGQAGMQPQPKVVDQQIDQMVAPPPQQMAQAMPEDQGIATLPAQNMQNFASGGIVAFGGGGDVPGYAGGVFTGDPLAEYLKQIGMSPQEFITKNGNEQQQIRAAATAAKPLVPPPAVPVAQAAASAPVKPSGLSSLSRAVAPIAAITDLMYPSSEAEKKAALPYKMGAQAAVDEQGTKVAAAKESAEAYAARKIKEFEATLPAGQKMSPEARNKETDRLIAEKVALELATKRKPIDPTGQNPIDPIKSTSFKTDKDYGNQPASTTAVVGQDGTQQPAPPPAPAAVKPNADDAYMSGINKLLGSVQTASSMGPINKLDAKRYSYTPAEFANMTPEFFADAVTKAMGKDPAKDPFGGQTEELTKTAVAAKQNYKTDLEKQFKEQGLAFEGTLKKLTEKEGRINTMEERNTGMALLEAGLSMMSGESPHALVNIGKGAQVGTKKYAEGMAQIEAARDKLDDAKMKIEEFRRNEANMNARESRAAQKDIDDTLHQGAVLKLAGMRDAFNMNKQQAIASVTTYAQIQQFNVGEKNKAAAQNQQTAANIDTAYAQMANQAGIAERARSTQLGLAGLEAKYRQENPAAGSLNFYKQLGGGDAVKGLAAYSSAMGPEGKGTEAILLDWQKKSPIEKQMARKADPVGSALLDRQLQERVLQGSTSDTPAGKLLDKQ